MRSLAEIEDRAEVELTVTVASPNSVTSPVSGIRAALLHIEVFEMVSSAEMARRQHRRRGAKYQSLDEVVLGGVITLRDPGGAYLTLSARRVRLQVAGVEPPYVSLDEIPPSLVTVLRRAEGQQRGPLVYREVPVRDGDRVRVQAFVEPAHHVIARGYRSAPEVTFVARDDVAPVFIEVRNGPAAGA